MTPEEAAALAALRVFARAVRSYHAVVDAGALPESPEYIAAADAMEDAESDLIEIANAMDE